jgi:radical SAM protein with 4Fe4S-binding SPASM domain
MISLSKLLCDATSWGDRLRYAHRPTDPPRPIVVFNCTTRCNLTCLHCYAANEENAPDILTGEQVRAIIDDLAAFGVPVLLFSGGEPLLRPDLPELIAYASGQGLRPVISTNGTLIDAKLAATLARAGLVYAGVSIDGLAEVHDRFRGQRGAFDAALAGLTCAADAGIKVGLRMTVTRHNLADVPGVFDLVAARNIPRVCFYHLVYTGRGLELMNDDLSNEQKRQLMDTLIARTETLLTTRPETEVLTVDNHADGIYLYLHLRRTDPARAQRCLELLQRNGGNRTGEAIACIGADGAVYADQFWRTHRLGNVLRRPFSEIWSDDDIDLLAKLRSRKALLTGRCGRCRWQEVCNGNFRARAEAVYADPWAQDPACYLTDEEICDT